MPYKTIFWVGTIMALRMLGLFMVMPLLALYVANLPDTTPLLVGVALGIYGLTQACFQIPIGIISDFHGRKTTIAMGLLLFALGSFVAASAESIFTMIIGRTLQGAGAVGGSLMALASDLTEEKHRTQAMAAIGGIIGISFSVSIVLGPTLNVWLTVPTIFLLSSIMGLLAIGILLTTIPSISSPSPEKLSPRLITQELKYIKDQKTMFSLNISSMILHLILVMNFIGIPIALKEHAHLAAPRQWWIYLPVLILSFAVALKWIMLSRKKKHLRFSMLLSMSLIAASQAIFILLNGHLLGICVGLLVFFTGFNFLEATLPSEFSKQAKVSHRGMAMGIYSTTQFMGIFLGGLLGGAVYSYLSIPGIFIAGTIIASMWFLYFLLNRRTLIWPEVSTK